MKKLIGLILVSLMTALTTNAQSKRYDINYDGVVDVTDVMLMVNKILQPDAPDPYERKLTFQVSEKPMTSDRGESSGKQRSPQIFTNTLDHFYINMMYEDDGFLEFTDRSSTHPTDNGYYKNNGSWPMYASNNTDVTIFAYLTSYKDALAPFLKPDASHSYPYLSVTVEESSDDQCDMLVAKNIDTWNNSQGVVTLEFNHICAALQFKVKKSEQLENYDVLVNEVKLHNVKNEGVYNLNDNRWVSISGNSNFTLQCYLNGAHNAVTVSQNEQLLGKNENDYLFLLPQVITGMEKGTATDYADSHNLAYLELKCKISKGEHYYRGGIDYFESVFLPFSATLQQGRILPVTILIGSGIRKEDGNSVFSN